MFLRKALFKYCILATAEVALCSRHNLLTQRLLCNVQVILSFHVSLEYGTLAIRIATIVCLIRKNSGVPCKCVQVGTTQCRPSYDTEKPLYLNSSMKSLFASVFHRISVCNDVKILQQYCLEFDPSFRKYEALSRYGNAKRLKFRLIK